MKYAALLLTSVILLSGCASMEYHHIRVKDGGYNLVLERKGFLGNNPQLLLEQQEAYFIAAQDVECQAMEKVIQSVAGYEDLELRWNSAFLSAYSIMFQYEEPSLGASSLRAEKYNLTQLQEAKNVFENVGGTRHREALKMSSLITERLCGKRRAEFNQKISWLRSFQGRKHILAGGEQ